MTTSPPTSTPNDDMVRFSFTLTYILLLTTGTVTFIEALRTENRFVRHVMNLETCISFVAGYFYSIFLVEIGSSFPTAEGKGDNHNDNHNDDDDTMKIIDWSNITKTRYTDWCITTPLMLLTLCIVLGMQTKRPLHYSVYLCIVAMNYTMLYIGYLGETGKWNRLTATILGFIPFFIMFAIIYVQFVLPKYVKSNYVLFGMYFVVWSLYGVVYMLDEISKNIALNVLDCVAKCFIGLGLWVYYTKVIV
jgi:bacteriorhodopsin